VFWSACGVRGQVWGVVTRWSAVREPHDVKHESEPPNTRQQQLIEKRIWHHDVALSHR